VPLLALVRLCLLQRLFLQLLTLLICCFCLLLLGRFCGRHHRIR
jgi:hypothetical protein